MPAVPFFSLRLSPALLATLVALALILSWDLVGLDLRVARLSGGASGFSLRDHWVLTHLLHDAGRRLAWLLVLALCIGVWFPFGPLRQLRTWQRLRLAVATLTSVLAVSLLKSQSSVSCPWDLQTFGGWARHVSHWRLQPDGGSGRCFPAGHASAGFIFLSGFFSFRDVNPALARRCLVSALAAGLVFGVAQQLRGAHFMSHTSWTGWICWVVAWAVHHFWPATKEAY